MFKTSFNAQAKLWSGLDRFESYEPGDTIGKIILKALDGKKKVLQISANNGVELTNDEIRQKTIRVAQNLIKIGITNKDTLGFCTRNSHYLTPVIFGTLVIGAPINPIDPSYKKYEIVHMFNLTKPSMVFVDSDMLDTMEDALLELKLNVPIFVFGDNKKHRNAKELFDECGLESEFVIPTIDDGMKQIAVIICSSGTTGLSKGVSLSNSAILNNTLATLLPDSIILNFSSMYWLSGFSMLITCVLSGCTRIITTDEFDPELMLRLIEKYKVTHTFTAPTSLSMVLKSPKLSNTNLSSLRFWACGGSTVPYEHVQKMEPYITNGLIVITYGITEITGGISVGFPNVKPHTVGQIVHGVDVKVVDDDGNRVGIGISGEICVNSKYNFLGYYGDKEATELVFDNEGFIKSGDIGHFDEEGDLFLVDRKKDIFKYKSTHISPSEIENIILKLDGVKMVSVVGIADIECMDLPAAAIVKSDCGDAVNVSAISDILANNLNDACQLRGGVYYFDSLPMTPSGKVIRREVRRIVTELHRKTQLCKL